MNRKDVFLKRILPILILVIGVGLTIVMVKTRSVPQREEKVYSGQLVEVLPVQLTTHRIEVPGTGTVRAARVIEIIPQVSGKIDSVPDHMVEGGFFAAGDKLFAIEKIDYELALERARANLAQAELELMRTESQARIARLEWERIKEREEEKANPLTLYEPQMKAAKAQIASARSAVRQAELDLERTSIRAPFNCYVRSEQIDLGQFVRAGTPVATIAGTDQVEIVVPLPLEELIWLNVPQNGNRKEGSPVTVRLAVGNEIVSWEGRIIRSFGEVDPRNRMARVVVAVRDPFGRKLESGSDLEELKPGMFVDVVLHGIEVSDVIAVPRGAIRDHDTVWTVDENDRLEIRKVEIVRRTREQVLVEAGLETGDRVVLTGLSAAADGMLLRPRLQEDE